MADDDADPVEDEVDLDEASWVPGHVPPVQIDYAWASEMLSSLRPTLDRIAYSYKPQIERTALQVNEIVSKRLMGSMGPFLDSIAAMFKGLGPALERWAPSNWHGLSLPNEGQLEQLVLEEGLPLAWVPPARVLEQLLDATSAQARRRIIGRNQLSIIHECRVQLDRVTSPKGLEMKRFINAALRAIEDGHREAGQALATNAIESMGSLNVDKWKRITAKNQRPIMDERTFRDALVIGGIWASYQNYRPGSRNIPNTFSRHATAHGVSNKQYSLINALLAVMHATSLARLIEIEGAWENKK